VILNGRARATLRRRAGRPEGCPCSRDPAFCRDPTLPRLPLGPPGHPWGPGVSSAREGVSAGDPIGQLRFQTAANPLPGRTRARFDASQRRLPAPDGKRFQQRRPGASMTRTSVAIFSFLAIVACTTATVPKTWTRPDGGAIDPSQLEADKTICQREMEQAELVTHARALVPIYLPGQESPSLKVFNGCMVRHGYAVAR